MAGAVIVPAPPAAPRRITLITAAHDATGDSLPDGQDGSRWTHGFTYAPENYTAGHVRDVCDLDTVDQPALPTPGTVTATPATTGGTLAAGVHGYRVTATRGGGETLPSAEVTATTTGATGTVALSWAAVYGATGYRVYGRTAAAELHLADVTAPAFTDTGAGTPAGALPVANSTAGPGDYTNLGPVVFQPYAVVAEDRCSAFGFEARDYAGRARRQLDAVTPKQVEREFWTGAAAQAHGYPNRYLTDGHATDVTTTPGTAMTRQGGFEALEEAIASCGYGPRGMIHCPAQINPPFGFTRRQGDLLLTNLDTVIVPGVGYPGTAPNGAAAAAGTTWIYATPMVDVRLDVPQLFPDPDTDPNWRFEALDRNRNLLVVRAFRLAAASFDGPCVFAAQITLDT